MNQHQLAAPFALTLSIGGTLMQLPYVWTKLTGLVLFGLAFLVYGTIQVRWFAHSLGGKLGRGVLQASLAMVESLVLLVVCLLLFS